MKHFQEYLHAFDSGAGQRIVRLAVVLILFGFVALAFHVRVFRGLSTAEGMNMAQLARNVAEGRGYVTYYITPMEIARLTSYYATPAGAKYATEGRVNFLKVPELAEPPAYPVALGMWLKVLQADFGESINDIAKDTSFFPDQLVAFFGYFCLLLTGLVLYVWVSRMFDRRVGLLSLLGLVLCEPAWVAAGTGEGLPMLMLLVTMTFAALHEALLASEEDRTAGVWIWLLISGVMLAAAVWTRMVMLWMLPAYALVLLVAFRTRFIPAGLAVLLVVVAAAPWYLRNYQLSGNPLGMSARLVAAAPAAEDGGEPSFGTTMEERSMMDRGWSGILGMARLKLVLGARYMLEHFFGLLGTSIIIVLFVAGLLHPFRRWRAQALRILLVLAIPLLIIGGSLFNPRPAPGSGMNLLLALWPAMAGYGVAFFYVLLDRLNPPFLLVRYMVIALFVFLCALPLLLRVGPSSRLPFNYPPYFPPMLRVTGELLQPQEILVSDMPWATAWYGGRASILMPSNLAEFYEINDSMAQINGMLLTPQSWNQPLMDLEKGPYPDWVRVVKREGVPQDFPLKKFLPMHPRKNDYYFFSDKIRW